MKKNKVLFICHHTKARSLHRQIRLAKALSNLDFKITIMVISDEEKLKTKVTREGKIIFIETPDLLSGRLRTGWDLYDLLIRLVIIFKISRNYDLFHVFETRPISIFPSLMAKFLFNKKLIIDWVDWWGRGGVISINRPKFYQYSLGYLETFIEEYFRKFGDGHTVISTGLEKRLKKLIRPYVPIHHLQQGVPLDEFIPLDIQKSRKKLGLNTGEFLVGFSSQDSFFDMNYIFETLRMIDPNKTSIKLLLMGKVSPKLTKYIFDNDLTNRIIITGFVEQKKYPVYLSCCNAFFMPFPKSNYNLGRWPNKFGEYLSLNRPVIFHDYGELSKINLSIYPLGIKCPVSKGNFYSELMELYDDDNYKNYNNSPRKFAEKNLNWDLIAKKLTRFYLKILNKNGKNEKFEKN